jgi:restriction endonuclease S subunit
VDRVTRTGGRAATTRHIPPVLALAVGRPSSAAPAGWQWRPLSELAHLESGHTPSRRHPEYWGGDIPWISIPDAKKHHGGVIESTEESTNDLGIVNSSARVLPARTVCLSRTASVGYVVITSRPMATSQDFVNWTCGEELLPEFLQYLLIAEGDGLLRFASGAVHKTIYFPEVKAFHVCVPSVDEQRRIVAILDEAFEGIARARPNVEKNLKSARELFENHLERLFSDPGENWHRIALERVGTTQTGTTPKSSEPERLGDFLPFVKPGDFNRDGSVTLDNEGLSELGAMQARVVPASSVLMVCIGATIGKAGFTEREIATNQQVNAWTPTGDVLPKFIYYQMTTRDFQRRVREGAGQATLPIINKSKWSALTVVVPSERAAQIEIVTRLNRLLAESMSLEDVYERKLRTLAELKESLLHQAFSGQLTLAERTIVALRPAPQTATLEYTANIIALAYMRHERQKRERTFGHVKEQKMLHLVEAIAKVDLGRRPMKDAAGPNDFQHMLKAEEWAKANSFFEMAMRGEGYEFRKLSAFDEHLSRARRALQPLLPKLESVIDLVVPMDTEETEVFATVHAAWNNLLIDGAEVTDDAIVSAAREGWHVDKLEIPEHKFRAAIKLIRQKGLVPDGTAKYVGGQQRLL